MSQPPIDALRLALGHEHVDRRADLRRAGWDAVPQARLVLEIDEAGEISLQDFDRSASPRPVPRLALAPADQSRPDVDLLLGVDSAGAAIVGRMVTTAAPEGVIRGSLRTIGLRLDDEQRAIVTELVALAAWHRTHPHCPRCGSPTQVAGLGWWRTCPVDGTEHYPRTDPAIIVLLRDDEDNALLGRQRRWPEGAFSTLAGFVEAGESAESAIVREVQEEVGLTVRTSQYLGSQPWPFPASLMLGFHSRMAGVRPEPQVDGDEIAEARWVDREELPALADSRAVRLPGKLSIAHHLIARWYGQEIPDSWCRW